MIYFVCTDGTQEREIDAFDAKEAAEKFAEYFHTHCDGWECAWPMTFVAHTGDGVEWEVEVDREAVPHFYARKAKQPEKP